MKIDLDRIIAIDFLIRRKSTSSPEHLAKHLGISKRSLYMTIDAMKTSFNAPIYFCRQRGSYLYREEGGVVITFQAKHVKPVTSAL